MSGSRPHACPHCGKTFGCQSGLYSHVKTWHGRKLARPLRPKPTAEPSMWELEVEAREARAAAEPVDPIIAEMFDV